MTVWYHGKNPSDSLVQVFSNSREKNSFLTRRNIQQNCLRAGGSSVLIPEITKESREKRCEREQTDTGQHSSNHRSETGSSQNLQKCEGKQHWDSYWHARAAHECMKSVREGIRGEVLRAWRWVQQQPEAYKSTTKRWLKVIRANPELYQKTRVLSLSLTVERHLEVTDLT